MTGFYRHKELVMLSFPVILRGITASAAPDPRLLALVPAGAQLVAGISAPSIQGKPNSFVLMTQNNSVDLEDFFALSGADDTLVIHQIVFVAMANKEGQPNEHSLLVSGKFDQPHVFKSAIDGGAAVTNYRRIPVLEIRPFAREHGMLNDVRWLAVLDSSVLVFGSVASTRLELDRYIAQIHTDDSLVRRLGRLRGKDQTWCLLSASSGTLPSLTRGHEIQDVLAALNPELAELAQSGNELEIGLYYGRRVEFEYEVTLAPTPASRIGRDSFQQPPVEPAGSASLLPTVDVAEGVNILRARSTFRCRGTKHGSRKSEAGGFRSTEFARSQLVFFASTAKRHSGRHTKETKFSNRRHGYETGTLRHIAGFAHITGSGGCSA